MRVRWHNVCILMLAVVVALMAARPQTPIGIFLRSMDHLGPGHSADQRALGLIAWLLVVILFAVVLRALLNRRGR